MTTKAKIVRMPSAPVADQRLLNTLKHGGRIDSEAAATIARTMSARSQSGIDAVIESGALTEYEIARTLAAELKLPFVDLHSTPCEESVSAVVNKAQALHYGLVPCRLREDRLIIAMANPLDKEALGYIESASGLTLQPAVATISQILEAIDTVYRSESSLNVLLSGVPQDPALQVVQDARQNLEQNDIRAITREAEQPPIVKIVNVILLEAFKQGASDVHIEPGPNAVVVRFRIDGILEETLQFPRWVHAPIVARIKVMSKLDITERRVPQDGNLAVRVRDSLVDVRVSSMPTTYGEKIVMRLLDPSSAAKRLTELGLSEDDLALLRSLVQRPEGMVLVTGPTGSGKTTTLYGIIQEIFSPELNIVTIENPVEYEMKGVSQTSINEKQGLTFAQVLRSELRQDPDVILVGEIRDRETAEIAFQAAQTGHLVLSTVHTNDSVATIARLLDLGVDPQVMGPSLLAVISQRLVRKVCPSCAEPTELDEESAKTLGLTAGQPIRRGRGCPSCRNTGFRGRTGCYEILKVTRRLEQLIEQKAPESDLRSLAEEEGMKAIVENARAKILGGMTTPAEVLRVIDVEIRGAICPGCRNSVEANFTVCPFCRTPLKLCCVSCGAALKRRWTTCPFCAKDAAPLSAEAAVLPEAPDRGRELGRIDVPKILVVDDNEGIVELLRLTLTKSSPPVEVYTALSGQEALSKIKSNRPHLVILDLMMPGMDGYEVCKRLRADLATALIPVIMLTARGDSESKRLGFLAGTDDYIVKPFERSELIARLHRLMQRTYGWSAVETGAAPVPGELPHLDA